MKRSFFSAFSLIMTMCLSAAAYSGGSGTSLDPYRISSKADLLELAGKPADYGKHFIQSATINLKDNLFTGAVIAPNTAASADPFQGTPFTGSYDGQGHVIKNLTIEASGAKSYIGLFGKIAGSGCVVKNVSLHYVTITAEGGANRVGGVCGSNDGALLSGCHVTGMIAGGHASTGGLCGVNYGVIDACSADLELTGGQIHSGGLCGYNGGTIRYSCSDGYVNGSSSSTRIGGLCGYSNTNGVISQCYSFSAVVGGEASLGGLCGVNDGAISDCFATGAVSSGANYSGGLCGYNHSGAKIERSYSTGTVSGSSFVGGLCGTNHSNIVKDSFWDINSSGVASGGKAGTGKTTAQMKTQSTFTSAGWNFAGVWQMDGYPDLKQAVKIPEKQVDFILLEGAEQVVEEGVVTFSCTAFYMDESSAEISGDALWSADPEGFCTISNGVVTTKKVAGDTRVMVIAAYRGLMASNTLDILNIPATRPPYSESFEAGLGVWEQIDDGGTIWTLTDEPTPTIQSGPATASDGDWFIYVEATDFNPAFRAGIEAEFDFTYSGKPKMTFDYHMYGQDMGSLHVDLHDGTSWSNDLWSVSGQQQSSASEAWKKAVVDLSQYEGTPLVKIRLRAITGSGYKSDIAVDNIRVESTKSYSGGIGSVLDPYLISNRIDLLALSYNQQDYDKNFKQIADIDLQGDVFSDAIIANDPDVVAFTGSYNGGGYEIQNLVFDVSNSDYETLGLFGYISGAELKNIALNGVTMTSVYWAEKIGSLCAISMGSVITNCSAVDVYISCTNSAVVGGLVGALGNENYNPYFSEDVGRDNKILGCAVQGVIRASESTEIGGVVGYCGGGVSNTHSQISVICDNFSSTVGGVAGVIAGTGGCTECSSDGTITGLDADFIGGLCGVNSGVITLCSSSVAITNVCAASANIGGLCGSNGDPFSFSSTGSIEKSYATGVIVIEGNADRIGGLCGDNLGEIKASYSQGSVECKGNMSYGGGLCGANEGVVSSSFSVSSVNCYGVALGLGGLCGDNFGALSNSYSVGTVFSGVGSTAIGGLCGQNHAAISGCYWDTQRSGLTESAGGTAATTIQLQSYNTFYNAGWDFVGEGVNGTEDIWIMDEYPVIFGLPFEYDFPPVDLSGIVVLILDGTNMVDEMGSVQLNMTAYFDNQTSQDVTDKTTWSVQPAQFGDIVDGLFTAGLVASNLSVDIIGSYGQFAVTQQVTIVDISRPPFHESFEGGFGVWVQGVNNDFDWVRHQGSTSTPLTGPSGASDGAWYLLADADNYPNKSAMVESEFNLMDAHHPRFTFDYHMYGRQMGKLHVDLATNGVWVVDLWSRDSEQHASENAPWSTAEIDLSAFAGQAQVLIRLRAVTGAGYMGDIGVDNIRLVDVESVVIEGADTVIAGQSVALEAFASYDDSSLENITTNASWSVSDDWYASVTNGVLTAGSVDFNVDITVTVSYLGHTNNHAITIQPTLILALPIVESFESGMGVWESSAGFDFDWKLNSGQTPTVNTGPSAASNGSKYLYIHAKDNSPYKEAAIEAEFNLVGTFNPLLVFDYHMYGADIGTLSVDVFDGTAWSYNLWAIAGEQHSSPASAWKTASVDLSAFVGSAVTIRFRAMTGQQFFGDIAVDYFRITDPYLEWLLHEGVPADMRGENDTPMGDGLPNLLKYACGLNAMQSYSTADYMNIATNLPAGQFGIVYYRSKKTQNVVLEPIWSGSPSASGSWSSQGLVLTKIEEDQEQETWLAVLIGEARGFMKLRAKRSAAD
ncbi:MAG: hypothetical protein PHO37_07620 [Kiritimatiellae bacterium]|nr:hypothetical protein [Kiritimatiellia bacterium]